MTVTLSAFCDAHDVRAPADTIATLQAVGTKRAIPMIEGILQGGHSQRLSLDVIGAFVEQAQAAGIASTLCAFPDVRDDSTSSRIALRTAMARFEVPGMLDMEPDGETPETRVHWTWPQLQPWVDLIPSLQITTTQVEYIRESGAGLIGRKVIMQVRQPSPARLASLYGAVARLSPEDVVLCLEPYEGQDVAQDIAACAEHARESGEICIWSAHLLARIPEQHARIAAAMAAL